MNILSEISPAPGLSEAGYAGLLPIRGVVLRMRFTDNVVTSPYHYSGVTGFIKSMLQLDELPASLFLSLPDNGIPFFQHGDLYQIVVYCLPHSLPLLEKLIFGVRSHRPASGDHSAFGPRWMNDSISDALCLGRQYTSIVALTEFGLTELADAAQTMASAGTACLRLLSPVQLLRMGGDKGNSRIEQFCTDASHLSGALFLDRLRQSLDAVRRRLNESEGKDLTSRPAAELHINECDLVWHGGLQKGARDGRRNEGSPPQVKDIHGLSGVMQIQVSGKDAAQVWSWLVLGQYLGIGQRRGFGLGRYRLELPTGTVLSVFPMRSHSLLNAAVWPGNLDTAWDAIRHNRRRSAFEAELNEWQVGETKDTDARTALYQQAGLLVEARYQAPALDGRVIDKPKGGKRALAIPPLMDRVLQRAVAQVLQPLLEPVMYRHSYGYRPGRSRLQVRDLIQCLVRDGYAWFFESDIDNFFDAVDPKLVRTRLFSLLPDDPAVEAIDAWLRAQVSFAGQLLPRSGLPQGSPLSPLLANLVLDDFDSDLVAAGFQPIRFADDFVIPCRTREEAEAARTIVERSLSEKKLTLNAEQSRVARFADGLKFLGYRFINDLAVETSKAFNPDDPDEDPAPGSWLAAFKTQLDTPELEPDMDSTEVKALGEADQVGTVVIVGQPGSVVYSREGRLWQQCGEQAPVMAAPWNEIGAIILIGRQRITQPAMQQALARRVPVFFTDAFGRLTGRLSALDDPDHCPLWRAQGDSLADTGFCLTVARSLVAARIHHQILVLRRRSVEAGLIQSLTTLERHASRATELAVLLGVEGQAARLYFGAIKALLPEWTAFEQRNRRPPRDPFNVLLSLGYTMLAAQVETLIRVRGLLPGQGYYHQPHGRHMTLVSDLMEPFRHLVEACALTLIKRRQLAAADFTLTTEGACRLTDRARRLYLTSLCERFSAALTAEDGASTAAYSHMYRQVDTLAQALQGSIPFVPSRFR